MIVEGSAGSLRVGSEVPPPEKAPAAEKLFEGTVCNLKVYGTENGRAMLDAKIEVTTTRDARKDSIRLTSLGVHIIEAVKLGEKISVPLGKAGDRKDTRLEVVVSEVGADAAP